MSANLPTVPEPSALTVHNDINVVGVEKLASMTQTELVGLVKDANSKATKAAKQTLLHVGQTGLALIYLKEKMGHGEFMRSVECITGISQRTANNYMAIARQYGNVSNLRGVSDALRYIREASGRAKELDERDQARELPSKSITPPAPAPAPVEVDIVPPSPAHRSPAPLVIDAELVEPAAASPDEAEPDQDEAEPDAMVVDGTAPPPVEDPPSPPRGAAHVSNNGGNNEWYTPSIYIESAVAVMEAIDLDPASCDIANKTVGAAMFYDKTQDGLARPWKGRVWMNPPYAQPLIKQFADRLVAEVKKGAVTHAIALVNNGTETEWFQAMAGAAAAICFPKGRVRFTSPDGKEGSPLQGQAFLYFGNRAQRFIDTFKSSGQCVVVVDSKGKGDPQ
jgi:hypothetical protein